MRLALLIIVFYIFERGESRLGKDVEPLCTKVVDRAVGFDGEDVRFAVLFGVNPASLGLFMATDQVISYLLLILREGLVFLEKMWDVGLVGYLEHGDSLDGHFGGGACGDVAVTKASEESGKCEMAHQLYRGVDRKAWRDMWHILGPWFGDRSRLSLRLSVSTVWTSRLVINYLKTTGAPILGSLLPSNSGFGGDTLALHACIFGFRESLDHGINGKIGEMRA